MKVSVVALAALMFSVVQGIERTQLHQAVLYSGDECTRLLANGANPNATDNNGQTPLHIAVKVRAILNVQTLLRAKADPNIRDANGQTPLHLAAANNDSFCVNALLKANANPSLRDKDGRTPYNVLNDYLVENRQYMSTTLKSLHNAMYPQPTNN